ncbi:hypothetical protein HHK36_020074 [Tetracentron sinense]|uniref:Cytochrome P450 n=1 Tax=Tetracentron sinense TaxID=13715 RepID=A0A834YYD0_TETSI|nr:hypothetical protein HHK36_020074 [Tetracentron sinense]
MDSLTQSQGIAICVFLFTLISLYCLLRGVVSIRGNKNKSRAAPEPAGAWPIIGHLHLLTGRGLPHRTLGTMADKYGPVFTVRLGMRRALVVSSWEVAKECFTINDRVFATRPKSVAIKQMGYNHAMLGFAPYGPYWREVRKIATLELLSSHRLEMLKQVRDSEINILIKELYQHWLKKGSQVSIEMKQIFGDLAINIIVKMIAGKRYAGTTAPGDTDESRRCQKAMADFMHLVGEFMMSDAIPFLEWFDVQGYKRIMKRTASEVDILIGSWIEEHRRKRLCGSIDEGERDFIHVMLSILEDGHLSGYDADTVLKANCLSLILGGNDTTVVSLTWTISLLLKNRQVLKKAQDELDIHVGRHRQVDESDVKNLVYLHAIVKETLRLYPALPISAPHEAMEDCTVAGFHVPAGTRLVVNLWKLHRDPRIWSDPTEFCPERFLTSHKDVDVRGQHFEFIPFGTGRRSCPGITFSLQVMHLMLARLLHGFELDIPSDSPVDMTESSGLTMPKATPLYILLTPRLPSTLYG